jgi:hypothetical protein
MMAVLRDYKSYRAPGESQSDTIEKTFRLIAQEENSTENHNIKNLRLNKKRFRQFLGKLYNARMADRIVSLFDFVNPLDLVAFVKQVEDIFLKGSQHQESAGRHLKLLAF